MRSDDEAIAGVGVVVVGLIVVLVLFAIFRIVQGAYPS